MRWSCFLVSAALILIVPGCRILGPFSPLRPVEQFLIYPQSIAPSITSSEQIAGRQVWLKTEDHQHLDARYFAHPNPQAVVLYCHGNVGTVEKWSILAERLSHLHRISILIFDYRGYGHSTGVANERGIVQDAETARNWLAAENGIQPCDVVLMGRSLGGAVAVDLASKGGARGLILESTFSSLPDVAQLHAAWLLPEWNMTQRMNSAEKIKNYSGPLLQSHGGADSLIPLPVAEKLFANAPGPKHMIVVPGADHSDDHIRYCAAEREYFFHCLP